MNGRGEIGKGGKQTDKQTDRLTIAVTAIDGFAKEARGTGMTARASSVTSAGETITVRTTRAVAIALTCYKQYSSKMTTRL